MTTVVCFSRNDCIDRVMIGSRIFAFLAGMKPSTNISFSTCLPQNMIVGLVCATHPNCVMLSFSLLCYCACLKL